MVGGGWVVGGWCGWCGVGGWVGGRVGGEEVVLLVVGGGVGSVLPRCMVGLRSRLRSGVAAQRGRVARWISCVA